MSETQERFRAIYVPQVPMAGVTIETKSLEHAVIALESMIALSIHEFAHKVKPDYSDMTFIERFEDGAWESIEEDEWVELAEKSGLIIVGSSQDDE